MPTLTCIEGDFLACAVPVLGHQVNCVTKGKGEGLAGALFERFPYADVYAAREKAGVPGAWSLHGNGTSRRLIVNLHGQLYPGPAKYNSDSEELRERWLRLALSDFLKREKPPSLALPWGIGCGSSGGHWTVYRELLSEVSHETGIEILIYRSPEIERLMLADH